MTTLLIALFVALAVGFSAWRVVVARRTPRPADTEIAPPAVADAADPASRQRTPEEEAARATARAKAERVIAAETARRKAAIQKAQNLARAEAERRAAEAAKAAASLVSTLPAGQLPTPDRPAPAVAQAETKPAIVERTVPFLRPAPAVPAAPTAATVLKTPERTLIMLVDDSKMVRVKSSRLLASHGFQVVTANDGIDALKQLENCCPDLLITDVDMPGMDGFALVAALKGDARTRQMPLVMITSAEDRHREEALRVGVGLVMGKPYDEAALIAHIRSFRFFARADEAEALACA
ncbi:MAG: response regulator [Burkholderiales bacterium]|jgi:CheY-like chemotaxis protein|nr:response regulator [Burkholderiales bacterium]